MYLQKSQKLINSQKLELISQKLFNKGRKSKISCDRTVIQKKSLFLELKRFLIFKHLSNSAQKSARYI